MGYAVIRWIVRGLLSAWFRLRVIGQEHIPAVGPVILAANHPSQIDPVALGAAVRRRVVFLAAAELLAVPVLGALIRPFRPVRVRRGRSDLQAIRECLDRLSRGEALLVFPEGKISRDGRLQEARDGLAFLALRSRAPVIPIGVRGTYDVWPLGTRWPRRGRIEVRIGPAIVPAGEATRADQSALTTRVMQAIAGLAGVLDGPARATSASEPGTRAGDTMLEGAST